ncbi:MAG: hypothetical protein ACOX8P_01475 [Tepidanaerobacteraceae bacterium]
MVILLYSPISLLSSTTKDNPGSDDDESLLFFLHLKTTLVAAMLDIFKEFFNNIS